MAVETFEQSRQLGKPFNLYLFRFGTEPNSFFAYTDAENPILDPTDGKTYVPVPIDRDAINSTGTLDKATINIYLPQNSQLSELFRVYPPSRVVTLVVKQGHINDPDEQYLVVWTGRVISRDVKENVCSLVCEPVATSMRRSGLRRNYQFGCPHVLYGDQCKASKALATTNTTLVSFDRSEITLPDLWNSGEPLTNFLGGLAEWDNGGETESRTILRIITDTILSLSGPVRGIANGGAIKIIKGCDHTMVGCNDHNNINNFGGQPWIPTKNPIGGISPYI